MTFFLPNTINPPAIPAFLGAGRQQHFIDGKWVAPAQGEYIDTFNPATGAKLTELARGTVADVDTAVAAARRAFEGSWSKFTPNQRYELMLRVAEVLDNNFEELAVLESLDMGAPFARTRVMKNSLLPLIRYFATQALHWQGSTIPNSLPGNITTMTIKAPVGVVGGIIPWNAPLLSMWWVIGGTLASGCTAVIKAAEDASLTTLRTAELLVEAGVPPGVVNVITGLGPEAGAALAEHMDVDRISFTGSTATGRSVIRASASNMKRVQVELGGKSPDIVFADADMAKAVPGVAMGLFHNSGQICSAGTRIFVQRAIADEFAHSLGEFAKTITVGNPFDPNVKLGPVVSKRQFETVMRYIDIGQSEGAQQVTGGKRLEGDLSPGYFIEPTLFAGVTNDFRIAREEIFGPVGVIIPFDTEEEALRLANDTNYGLGAGLWTQSLGISTRMVNGLKAGKLWVNAYGLSDPAVGFSGFKQSGYGVKGGAGHIESFLYEKCVYVNAG